MIAYEICGPPGVPGFVPNKIRLNITVSENNGDRKKRAFNRCVTR